MNLNINKEILTEIKRISELMSINEGIDDVFKLITREQLKKIISKDISAVIKGAIEKEGYDAVKSSIVDGTSKLSIPMARYKDIYDKVAGKIKRDLTGPEKANIRTEVGKMVRDESLNVLEKEKNSLMDISSKSANTSKSTKTASNVANAVPIEDDLFKGLLNSVTPSQLDDELKILIKNLGVKFKLNPKNLELFRNELMGRFNILLNKKFPKDYASQLSFVSNELKTLSPSQQKSLLTDVTTNLEKSFGDILNKGKFSTTNKKELMTLLKFGFSRPFQGTIWERIKWIGGWWYHTIVVSGIITVTTTISEVSQHGILGAFQENIVGNKDAVDKFLTKIFLPGYNIIQAGIEAITSIYNAIVSRDDDEKNQSFLEKGESEWFKRKVAKKHPSFKFMNNITVENGQPYLMINDTNYPIYEDVNNAKYFIRVDGEGVYFDNLTN